MPSHHPGRCSTRSGRRRSSCSAATYSASISSSRFILGDARWLDEFQRTYDTVLDCGLFHVFDDDDRSTYLQSVRSVLVPGGRYLMLCFSDQEPGDRGPRRVTRDDIVATFADGWRIDSLERTALDSPTGSTGIRAWQLTAIRL